MRLAKYIAVVLILLVMGYLFLVNFSAVESRLACAGTMTSNNEKSASEVFLKLQKYRWWVGLWSDSQGSAWLEIPNKAVHYYSHVRLVGDQLQIFETPGSIKGTFSTLSLALNLLTPLGTFEGTCSESPSR